MAAMRRGGSFQNPFRIQRVICIAQCFRKIDESKLLQDCDLKMFLLWTKTSYSRLHLVGLAPPNNTHFSSAGANAVLFGNGTTRDAVRYGEHFVVVAEAGNAQAVRRNLVRNSLWSLDSSTCRVVSSDSAVFAAS